MSSKNFWITKAAGVSIGSPRYGRNWYAAFEREEYGAVTEVDELVQESSEWLLVPIDRREEALRRLRAMQRYESHEKPGIREADQAAREMGISRNHFYQLRRQWSENRSIFSLVPFHGLTKRRRSRLDSAVKARVEGLAVEAVHKKGLRAPKDILRDIQEGWDLKKPLPSHMTLRKSAKEALATLDKTGHRMRPPTSLISEKITAEALHFGDALVIEDVLLNIFVATDAGAVAPRLSLAIDLSSSAIVGHLVTFSRPSTVEFEKLLRDVEMRTRAFTNPPPDIPPRLIFKHEGTGAWNSLLDLMSNAGAPTSALQISGPSEATAISRLIGHGLGAIKFAPRLSADRMVFDPARHPLVSLDQLRGLIEGEVDKLNRRRLPAPTKLRQLQFGFLDQR